MFGKKEAKPIFLLKIFFEQGVIPFQKITESINFISKRLTEQLKDYHVLVLPILNTKVYEEPKIEVFYPSDFESKELTEFKKLVNEVLEKLKEQEKSEKS